MLELYYLEETDSICSNRAIITLAEKGITDWVPHKIVLVNRDQFKPEYLKLNPQGVVPTLVHDGKPIRESEDLFDVLDQRRIGDTVQVKSIRDSQTVTSAVKLSASSR